MAGAKGFVEAPSRSRGEPPVAGADRTVDIHVLGPVEVTTDRGAAHLGGPKQRAVFAMLVARLGSVVTTDELIDGIWGEDPPIAVLSSLHTYVSNLRASVGQPIERFGSGYRLDAERSGVDGYVFEDDVDVARRELVPNPTAASDRLRRTLALWRGRAYADVAAFPGLTNEATRLEELRLTAVESRIEADLALGRHAALVGELEALAAEHPLRESLRAKHMLALYRDGRQADALRAFRRTQEYLREELGLDPSPELQELEVRILNHDYSLTQSRDVVNERLALLFVEVVDSKRLWESHPAEMQVARARLDEILRAEVDRAGGAGVKSLGDGLIAAFSEPALAARAAAAAQRAILGHDWRQLELSVRMAIDTGEVERRGGGLFGPPMNRGSRFVAAAHGGQILLSVDAQRALGRDPGTQVKSLGEHRFRALAEAQELYQLVLSGLPSDFPPPIVSPFAVEPDRSFGDVVRGYELREIVGRSPFATVFRAFQPSIGREVAVKIVRPEFANHPAFVRRFETETRFVASLAHPHLATIHDYWRDADGAYLITPFLAGGRLAQDASTPVPMERGLRAVAQVGSGLAYAHRQGVLHRNIKPSNVLLDADANAYLTDFGVAARAVEAARGIGEAAAGYRAPEDRDGAAVDARADVYSLCALLASLLTGDEPPGLDLSGLDPRLRDALERGLAVDPDARPTTVEELLAVLSGAAGVAAPTEPARAFRNPYKGLAAFTEPDAPDFFGRTSEIRRAVTMVTEHRLSAVVGPSGSGKSSLVLAGVLPALRQARIAGSATCVSVVSVPGGHPFDEMATALAAVATDSLADLAGQLSAPDAMGLLRVAKRLSMELDAELIVVIDQFEELFTLVASPETRERFVAAIANAAADPAGRIRILLTLRADFFHEALSLATLGPIISTAHLALAPLDSDATHAAIIEPAEKAGLELERGLADRIIGDLADQPGSLPLLQFTLDRLAAGTANGRIGHAEYGALGGVRGAVAERADVAYRTLTEAQRDIARHVFTRLLTVTDDADDVRRRARVSEFRSLGLPEADVLAVLDIFGRERLLTFDVDPTTRGATVAVAHEAVLREWPTLLGWVESRRESLVLQRRFQAAHAEWEESKRNPANLLTGGRLSQYEEWAAGEDVRTTTAERAFLGASMARRGAEAAARRERRRRVLGGFAAVAALAGALAVVAVIQRNEAEVQRSEAERSASLAQARQLAASAIAVLDEDPRLSKLLALSAASIARPPMESVTALHQAWAADRVIYRYEWPTDRPVDNLFTDIDITGRYVVASGFYGHSDYLEVTDRTTNGVLWSFDPGDTSITVGNAFFTLDGERVVGGAYREQQPPAETEAREPVGVFVWDRRTGQEIHRWDIGECGAAVIGVSTKSALVTTSSDHSCQPRVGEEGVLPQRLELIDLDSGNQRPLSAKGCAFDEAALSGDGRWVAFDEDSGEGCGHTRRMIPVLVDLVTGERTNPPMSGASVRDINADGSLILYDGLVGTLQVWDRETGTVAAELDMHHTFAVYAEFAPNGRTIYTTSPDATLRAWDIVEDRYREVFSFPGVSSGRPAATDQGLVLAPQFGTLTAVLIDTAPRGELWAIDVREETSTAGQPCDVVEGSLRSTGGYATYYEDCDQPSGATTRLIDISAKQLVQSSYGFEPELSPDGTRYAVQETRLEEGQLIVDGITITDAGTQQVLVRLDNLCDYSDDEDDTVFVDGNENCQVFPTGPFALSAWQIRWSPDGQLIAAVNNPFRRGFFAVWNAQNGRVIPGSLTATRPDSEPRDVSFTPDGSRIVIAYSAGNQNADRLDAVSTTTWQIEATRELGGRDLGIVFVGYSSDGSALLAVSGIGGLGGGALHWFDPDTLINSGPARPAIHDGTPNAVAISPESSLVATAATDGSMRVWDATTGALVHEFSFRGQDLSGVAFLDETHLGALIDGDFQVLTVDTEELLAIVRGSLTRGFTQAECDRFKVSPCPSLDEMRSP